jgi:hypothetical protein
VSKDCYIRVVPDTVPGPGDIETPAYKATIIVRNVHICSAQAMVAKDDPDPQATAVGRVLHEFHQLIGQDIRKTERELP